MDQGGVLLQQQPLQAASQIGPSSHTYTGFSISDSSRAHLGNQYVSNYYYYDLQYEWKVTDLCYITYNAVHRALQSRRLPGTGTWLLNSDDFRRWRDDDESTTLWWYGSPGAGKTFLASNVIDHLRSLPEDQASPVLYLYASRDRMFEQSTTQYLACLARQLAESYLASLARHVVDSLALTKKRLFLIDVDRHSHAQDAQSVPALLLLLSRLTRHFSKVLIVLDALDEFSEDPNDQHDLLDALASLQAASRCILSMCVTSWQTHQDMAPLRPASALRVHTPDQELKMYIDARIRLSPRLRMFCTKADLHSEVISSVLNKAGNV